MKIKQAANDENGIMHRSIIESSKLSRARRVTVKAYTCMLMYHNYEIRAREQRHKQILKTKINKNNNFKIKSHMN